MKSRETPQDDAIRLPDILPVLGFTDDAAVLLAAFATCKTYIMDDHRAKARALTATSSFGSKQAASAVAAAAAMQIQGALFMVISLLQMNPVGIDPSTLSVGPGPPLRHIINGELIKSLTYPEF